MLNNMDSICLERQASYLDHLVSGRVDLHPNELMEEFDLHRPFKSLVLFLQPAAHALPWAGLDHEAVAFMNLAVEFQFLLQSNQFNSANGIDFLQKLFGISHLKDFIDGIRKEQVMQLEFRDTDEYVGGEHRPEDHMPIMVQLAFFVVVLDLPELPQRQVVDEAVFAAIIRELELVERMGMDRPHLFVLARRQNPVVEIRNGNLFFHQKKRQKLTRPLAGKLQGDKNKNRLQIRQINDLQTALDCWQKTSCPGRSLPMAGR